MRSRSLTWQLPVATALAGAWSVAGYFLWDSRVPDSLSLPHLDPNSLFSSHILHRAADFENFLELSWIGEQVALVAVFVAYARWGTRFMKESAAGPIGTGIFLAMMGFALTWFVSVPFDVVDAWWEKKYGVLNVGYASVVLGGWLTLGFTFLTLSIAVAIVRNIARFLPQLWWAPAVPVFFGIVLLHTSPGPYLLGGPS